MAKKVTIEIDAAMSSLRIASGRMFLGTRTAVELDGWEPDSANHRPVLTVFAQGSTLPLAQSSYADGAYVCTAEVAPGEGANAPTMIYELAR